MSTKQTNLQKVLILLSICFSVFLFINVLSPVSAQKSQDIVNCFKNDANYHLKEAVKANVSALCAVIVSHTFVDNYPPDKAIKTSFKSLNDTGALSPFDPHLKAFGFKPGPGVVTAQVIKNNKIKVIGWNGQTKAFITKTIDTKLH